MVMISASDIKGLSAAEIRDKFALKLTPTYVTDVNIPAGQTMRASTANGIMGNSGGGVQFEIKIPRENLNPNWFNVKNARPLK